MSSFKDASVISENTSVFRNSQINISLFGVPFNEERLLFKPIIWCGKQWIRWAEFEDSRTVDILKKIACFIPLVFATIASSFARLIGLMLPRIIYARTSERPTIVGSGTLAERQFDFSRYIIHTTELNGCGNLCIKPGSSNSLVVIADDNLLDLLHPSMENNKLSLGVRPNTSIQTRHPITYKLTIANPLHHLIVSGSGQVNAEEVNAPSFSCDIHGSGNVRIEGGQVDQQSVSISGSGHYDGSMLQANSSSVDISGSGKVTVQALRTLSAEISGSGKCLYFGNPNVAKSISGSGTVSRV